MRKTAKSVPWGDLEKLNWLSQQEIKRSYKDEVIAKLTGLDKSLKLTQYGALSINTNRYPLYIISTLDWQADRKTVLITGGVHGYETSGVQGAIRFLEDYVLNYANQFNLIVAPCISPWGYETINRWNPNTVDPNRSFVKEAPSDEALFVMDAVFAITTDIFAHIDLHETTDTDNTIFRPALAARDAVTQDNWNIPDGFYLVGDTEYPNPEFQKAIIESVEKVTHIAPPDNSGRIIGELLAQHGVINYPTRKLGLCSGFSNCQFGSTTEVYPDSDLVTDEDCTNAQVAAICGGLDFLAKQ